MTINLFQAALIAFIGYGGSLSANWAMGLVGGWYTLSRPLVSGAIIGLILGDVTTGIIIGVAVQTVFIALVTPGGQMPQDLNSAAYIGVALGLVSVKNGATVEAAVAIATAVGAVGTIFHNFMMITNSFWNHRAIAAINKGDIKGLAFNNMIGPQFTQMLYRVVPTFLVLYFGQGFAVQIIQMFPVDSFVMRTLTALGGLLPAVGVAILLKQIIKKDIELIYFLVGFTFIAVFGINMIALAIIAAFFAYLNFTMTGNQSARVATDHSISDVEEEL